MWTIKVSSSGLRSANANSFFPTSSIHLVVGKILIAIYDY